MWRRLGHVAQLQFEMVCERPPAAFGGSPPHGGGDASEASEGVAHTPSRIAVVG